MMSWAGYWIALGVFLGCVSPAKAQSQRFSYPPAVVEAARTQADQREQEWRACFAQTLERWPGGAANWRNVAELFRRCRETEVRYVRAALRAAQREYPEPRTDQFGRIVAWDRINSHNRTMRRLDWLRIRRELEDGAMNHMRLPQRCERRNINNSGSAYSSSCLVSDLEMGMDTFDFQQGFD